MIRPAKFGDIPRLAELMAQMHQASVYADRTQVDPKYVKSFLMRFIQRHGGQHEGGTAVYVADNGETVTGFIIGLLDRIYHIGEKLMAVDVFWYGEGREMLKLLDAYIEWASAVPNVIEIKLSETDAINDGDGVRAVYARRGFRQCGTIWERS